VGAGKVLAATTLAPQVASPSFQVQLLNVAARAAAKQVSSSQAPSWERMLQICREGERPGIGLLTAALTRNMRLRCWRSAP